MKQDYQKIAREQLTAQVLALVQSGGPVTPGAGWIRAVREALGMSGVQLARRLKVAQATVAGWEKREPRGAITLASLRKIADALECTLVYALVPKSSFEDIVEKRARKMAEHRISRVAHSMRLEQQQNSESVRFKRVEEETRRLLELAPNELWDEQE